VLATTSLGRSSRLRSKVAGWGRRSALASPAIALQQLFYTTERVIELRTGRTKGDVLPKTLYDVSRETENCGVGLIASLKSQPTRDIVEKADQMLVRMAHRGGCGCDPASGDGSGECVCVR
jgi:hypothetical protein